MHINWEVVKQKKLGSLVIDFIMLNIAIINLLIFSFDYTYLSARNIYFHYLPEVVQFYDPIKGIEPHRFTEDYLTKANIYFATFATTGKNSKIKDELIELSRQMIDEDPFARARKSGELEIIKERMTTFMKIKSSKKAFAEFWNFTPANFSEREGFFKKRIGWIMETNYWRKIGTSGNFIDYYIYIDMVFVIIFLIEFLIMWIISVKRYGKDEKILYPLFHWYDVISCIPLQSLRVLRLLRVGSMYYKLVQNNIITVDEGPIQRGIKNLKEIAAEEISDRVSVKILSDIQDKVRLGANKTIVEETLLPHKDVIKKVLVKNIKVMEFRLISENKQQLVNFTTEVVVDTINELPQYKQLLKIPYVNDKLKKMMAKENFSVLVDQMVGNVSTSLHHALNNEVGESLLNEIINDILDEIIIIFRDETIQQLMMDINLQLLEEFKKGSTVKKWRASRSIELK
jgi:hypothetical protein